jgi:hypothetical protein
MTNIACQAKAVLGVDELQAVADRGYFSSDEILARDQAGITVTLPKPITSGIEAKGRFGKQDFVYLSDEDAYRCPALRNTWMVVPLVLTVSAVKPGKGFVVVPSLAEVAAASAVSLSPVASVMLTPVAARPTKIRGGSNW